jgi:hypothetical protein
LTVLILISFPGIYHKEHDVRIFVVSILILVNSFIFGQQVDSALIRAFPFQVGNVGFAIDSLEHFVGDAFRGQTQQYQIGMYNFGKEAISFKSGKISKFVTMNFEPSMMQPATEGMAIVDVEVIEEMPLGINQVEVAVETDDSENPFKFFYLMVNVVEDSSQMMDQLVFDTVPRLFFDQYNHYFGHLSRAKNVVHTFVFVNRGNQDLVIDEISTSPECSIIPPEETIIPPGSSGSLTVKVKTLSSFGVQHGTVSVMSNDPVNPVITLGMHGTVRIQSPSKTDLEFCLE